MRKADYTFSFQGNDQFLSIPCVLCRRETTVELFLSKELERMKDALRMIGYSKHTNSPRKGPKAQIARYGLGEDTLPIEELK